MMLANSAVGSVGDILRQWRKIRKVSQMELALEANVSTRHLSFVESGRSHPSDALLLDLARTLNLPFRHTNALLVAAGYAPRYSAFSLEDDQMAVIRTTLEHFLAQHEPYPAVVINRTYDILMATQGFRRTVTWLAGAEALAKYTNVFRLFFAPDGLRPYCTEWPLVRQILLARLYEEHILYQDARLAELYAECRAAGGDDSLLEEPQSAHALPVLSFTLRKGSLELDFFSAITTFGSAVDTTVQELRIESLFPSDAATRQAFNPL